MHPLSVERQYSKKEIKEAGRLLAGRVQRSPEVEQAFRILHNWRMHHAYPMVRERTKLSRAVNPSGGLTAGRLKRISSIRKKLFRGTVKLNEMQDLVGCRAILDSMDHLSEVLNRYRHIDEGGRVRRKTDYIRAPKPDGYRSVHLIVKFDETGAGEKHRGCLVELQLRTRLQHVWATTVEAAGAMRNEDLKASEGCSQWLRFLALMSGHIADLEKQPRGENLPTNSNQLRKEVKELSEALNVRENLNAFRNLMKEAESSGGSHSGRYMLRMDAKTGSVDVTPAWRDEFHFSDLDDDFEESRQSLEVSIKSMKMLRQAYPNYFADTSEFLKILEDLEGSRRPNSGSWIDNYDLGFLRQDAKSSKKEKTVSLSNDGKVYWGDEVVGRWETGFYGAHFFKPGVEDYTAFQEPNRSKFEARLLRWLERE